MASTVRPSMTGQRVALALAAGLIGGVSQAQTACPVTHMIHTIQGSPLTQRAGGVHNDVSPLSASRVTIEGVVVGAYQGSAQLRGFFLQEEQSDEDGDAATSEGLFISTGSLPPLLVAEGQRVCVTGTVAESFGMTQVNAFTSGSIQLISAANHLGDVAAGSVTLPVAGDLNDYYEQFEGMLVRFPGDLAVADTSNLERFGEIALLSGTLPVAYAQGDSTPTASEYAAYRDGLARRRVLFDDDDNARYSSLPGGVLPHPGPAGFGVGVQGLDYFRKGDVLSGLTGVVHWSWAGEVGTDAWRIRPVAALPVDLVVTNARSTSVPEPGPALRVASLNLGNFFATIDTTGGTSAPAGADSAAELDRQGAKLAAALSAVAAHVVGVTSVENDGGYALQLLANQVNGALGSGVYDSIPAGMLGTGATSVGLIYDTRAVRPLGPAAALTDVAFTSPNGGAQRNQPALAQTFEVLQGAGAGALLTVVVNHFAERDATGAAGADADQNDGQGAYSDSRSRAATYLVDSWLATDPTGLGNQDVLLIGTLNAYAGEASVGALRAAGYSDVIAGQLGADAYTSVDSGVRGYTEHALASASLSPRVVAAHVWHINADEAAAFDYNDTQRDAFGESTFEVKPAGRALYEPNAFRAAARDPVIVDLALVAPVTPGDADGDGDIDRDDLKLINRTKREPSDGPGDARDVDGDGYISTDDVKLARDLCTRPHCSPQ